MAEDAQPAWKNIGTVEGQKHAPAPETRKTVGHLEHKNDIIVNLTLQLQKFLFLIPVLVTYISKNRAANFVEICNIYTNQIITNMAISTINSNKLSHNYDQM